MGKLFVAKVRFMLLQGIRCFTDGPFMRKDMEHRRKSFVIGEKFGIRGCFFAQMVSLEPETSNRITNGGVSLLVPCFILCLLLLWQLVILGMAVMQTQAAIRDVGQG